MGYFPDDKNRKMAKTKKTKKKEENSNILLGILIFIGIILFILLLDVFIFPLISAILGILLSLMHLYTLLSKEAMFFGGFIFLFILWKFLESLVGFLLDVGKHGYKLIKGEKEK